MQGQAIELHGCGHAKIQKDLEIGRKDAAPRAQRESLAESHDMQAQWIYSSTFLPYTGEPIEFMLEDRQQPIHGIFANGLFHSRWADYDADRVQSWRESDDDPSAAPIAIPKAALTDAFIATFKRLRDALSPGRQATAIIPSRSHARTRAASDIALRPVADATESIDRHRITS